MNMKETGGKGESIIQTNEILEKQQNHGSCASLVFSEFGFGFTVLHEMETITAEI